MQSDKVIAKIKGCNFLSHSVVCKRVRSKAHVTLKSFVLKVNFPCRMSTFNRNFRHIAYNYFMKETFDNGVNHFPICLMT